MYTANGVREDYCSGLRRAFEDNTHISVKSGPGDEYAMRSIRASPLCRAFPGPSIVGPMRIVVPSVHVKVHSIFLILPSSTLGVYVCSRSNSSVGKRS